MGWPDLSRWIWSYVISRLKLFTDLDPSKLELSGRSLSVANVDVDKDRIAIPGVLITQFVIEKLTVELTSSGLAIGASGVNIDAFIKSLEPPDLAISRILEQTRTDMEGYGAGDMSGMKSRFADFALSQVKLHVTDVRAALRYPNSDVLIRLHVDQIVMNQRHLIEFESVIITRESCGSDTDTFSESSSFGSNSDDDEGNNDFDDAGDDDDDDDMAHNKMANSIFLGKHGSLMENSPLVKSVYFDAQEGRKHDLGSGDDEELGTINRVVLKFSMDPLEVSFDIDRVRVDGLLALQTVVDTLNLVWKASPTKNTSQRSVKSELTIASVDIYETLSDSSSVPASLTNIRLQNGELDIRGMEIPNVLNISPFLTARSENDELIVDMPLPASLSLSIDSMPYVRSVAVRIGDILSELTPPPDPRPTPVRINLPEFRLAIGQNFTLLVFPESLSNSGFKLREILLTASEGQLLIKNLECQSLEDADGLTSKVEELHIRLSSEFLDELQNIGLLLSGKSASDEPDTATSRWPWIAIDMPRTCCKVETLLVEDSDQILLRGEMELKTADFVADLKASLSLDHQISKTSFEFKAHSSDGLKSIDSMFNFLDCDVLLQKYGDGGESNLSSSSTNTYQDNGFPSIPEIRCKLNFNHGIRVHFPDMHKSVFMISLDIINILVTREGVISAVIPELYVKLEDSGGDIPLLKMQETNITHICEPSGPEVSVKVKKAALATCPDTFSLITKLPALVVPPPSVPHFDVEPDTCIDIFKDVVQTRFTSEKLTKLDEEDLAVTLDSIDIKEDYMANRSETGSPFNMDRGNDGPITGTASTKSTKIKFAVRLAQWQMFDGFDLKRTRQAIGEAVNRIETAVADANESDKEPDDDDSERMLVGDFMYNSLFVVAQGGRNNKDLSAQVADELSGTGSEGYARSSEPKLTLSLRRSEVEYHLFADARSLLSVSIRDGKISDAVPTSAFSHLLAPMGVVKQPFLVYTQETIESVSSPELRVAFAVQPLHLQLDQDTIEFLNRFFQFDVSDEVVEAAIAKRNSATFLQRFEFSELPLVIDYTPKKVDYKSLRSGAAAELVNLFVVKGARLTLRPCVLHGVSGWDRLLQELSGLWGPDIRANQLGGLLSGIWPVRKALKLGEGIKSWAIVPMKSKRTGQVTRGAGLLVRRTMDELIRLRTVWIDSADKALGGETDSNASQGMTSVPFPVTSEARIDNSHTVQDSARHAASMAPES